MHNLEIKGEVHEKVTKCKKIKLSIFSVQRRKPHVNLTNSCKDIQG